jgi:gas vesicle protein
MKKIYWMLTGVTLGAATSLLSVPRAGWRTRRRVRRQLDYGCEYLSVARDDLREALCFVRRRATNFLC